MNAYNSLASVRRLDNAGLPHNQAEAIADEIGEGTSNLVTRDQLEAALDKQTIKIGIMVSAIVALACTVAGVLLSH